MMYQAYEKKVRALQGYVRICKICIKCLIVLCVIAAVMTLGYFSLRGIRIGDFEQRQSIAAFGEKPEYSGFILFGTYDCEYAPLGSENWSAEQPITAGTYRVRAVYRKGFFGKVYSEPGTVELYRRQITLSPSQAMGKSVPYGEKAVFGKHWKIGSAGLIRGHKVKKAALASAALDGHGGLRVTLDASSVVIEDKYGRDVTDCYTITAGQGTLDVKKVQLTVVVADELKGKQPVALSKEYDGSPLYTNNYFITKGELVGGDLLRVTTPNPRVDAGKGTNAVDIKVYSSTGGDMSSYYQIRKTLCRVEITKKPLGITTLDQTLTYNGSVQYGSAYELSVGSLVPGHYMQIVTRASAGVSDVTARPVKNKIELAVYENGRDVTKNYDISYAYGELTMLPRQLTLRTQTTQGLIYNGEKQSATGYSVVSGSFAPGHTAKATSYATQLEPGSCENRVEYKIIDLKGKNVTDNYQFAVEYGRLTVEKGASLSLALKPLYKVYDAQALDPADFDVKDLIEVMSGKLYGSDYIEIVSTKGSQTDAGISTYTVEYRILHKVSLGKTEDATTWYAMTRGLSGTLTVDVRTLTLSFDAITKQYDGKAAVPKAPNTKNTTIARYEGTGHRIELAPGAMQNLVYSHGGSSATEIGDYTYYIPAEYLRVVKDDASGADRTQNYRFEFKNNTIRIDGIQLTLHTPSASKQYDGTPLSADRFSTSQVRVEGLSDGYHITFGITGSQTDAGSSLVSCSNIRVTDRSGADVTRNFKITVKEGKLTVTPLSITVRSSSGSKVYDGQPMENATQMTLVSGTLLDGHVLGGAVDSNYVTDVGTHQNDRVTPKVYSATGQDVSRNYKISLEAGTYTVTVCRLHVQSPRVQGEYCGKPYEGECDATPYAQGLGKGHMVKLQIRSAGELPGEYDMEVLSCIVKDARGRDVSKNYDITWTDGRVEIVPRRITVITGSSVVEYGKGVAINEKFEVKGSGLVAGHTLRLSFVHSEGLSEIGTVNNEATNVRVLDKNGRNISDLYEISFQWGTLRVTPIAITLRTGSAEKEVYDAQPIMANSFEITKGQLLDGHKLTVSYLYENGVSDVGRWKNELSSIRVVDRSGADVSHYYDFTVLEGTLHVKKPYTVALSTGSAEKIYDGTPLVQNEYALETPLLAGHSVAGVNTVELTEAGEKANKLTLVIYDENGRDVSKNYEFTYDQGLGVLRVIPRDLSVTIGQVELTYTGQSELLIYDGSMQHEGLVPGERICVRVQVESPDIGHKQQAEFINLRVTSAGGRDITHCYNVDLDTSALDVTVIKATLNLSVPSRYSKEYDGLGLTVTDVGYRPIGLAQGHRVEYVATEAPAEPGTYTLTFTEWRVVDREGNDVTGNYEVRAGSCQAAIYTRTVKLTSLDASRHYNGLPLVCHELDKYTLPTGYRIEVTFTGEQTEVGKSDNTFDVVVYDEHGNDITEFCTLMLEFGTLEVWDQIPLEVWSGSKLGIYDGTPFFHHDYKSDKLPDGYTIEVVFTAELTEPGEMDNTYEVIVYDPEGQDVTTSFAITKHYGTLTLLEKASDYILTLRSESASGAYDGAPLTHPVLEPYTLPDGFVLDVEFTGSQTDIGQSANSFVARAYNEAGEELTVVYEFGTLEVYLDLVVTPYEMTYIYDGTEKNCHEFWTQGLPDGCRVEVEFGQGLTVTGSIDVQITSVRVYDVNDRDITALCRIKTKTAKLTVLPRALTVYVYGQSADSIVPVQGTLVEGHTMFAEYGEMGECYIEITDQTGTLVYSNRGDSPIKHVLYDVSIQYG